MNPPMRTLVFFVLLLAAFSDACHPGRGGIRRRTARKMRPLIYKQHEPNFGEKSLAASGLSKGPVTRKDEAFRRLEVNLNPDIKFKDDEMTGADRLMTQVIN